MGVDAFLQISDTELGKNCAPSYAIIFVKESATTAFEKCYLKASMYFRYVDDI